jgi:hypothetical protein
MNNYCGVLFAPCQEFPSLPNRLLFDSTYSAILSPGNLPTADLNRNNDVSGRATIISLSLDSIAAIVLGRVSK